MEKLNEITSAILQERFGKDNVIALATVENGLPAVRYVNAYYEDGAFYVITYALSGKMKQLELQPAAAIAGDWFTAHGRGENMGYVGKAENLALTAKLRSAFSSWIDNGHTNFSDENTCILRLALTDGVLFSNGTRYEIDFSESPTA